MKKNSANKQVIYSSLGPESMGPNTTFLKSVHIQAQKIAELVDNQNGVQYIKDSLKVWTKIIDGEVERFKNEKSKRV